MKLHADIEKVKRDYSNLNMVEELFRLSREATQAVADLDKAGQEAADREDEFDFAYFNAMKTAQGKSKEVREAAVFNKYRKEKHEYKKAQAKVVSGLENVRMLRQQLSSLQTALNNSKEEMSLYNYHQDPE